MNKQNTFNDFRFEGLDYKEASNKYLTMKRVNAEAMENLTKKIVEHIIGKKPDLTLYECLELLSKKTDEKYVWKFVVVEYFSYVGNINNKRRRLIGYL